MTHTPKLWKADESGMYIFTCDVNGETDHIVVEIRGWGELSKLGEEKAIKIQQYRARRIAALWNAAEILGLSTDVIEHLDSSTDLYNLALDVEQRELDASNKLEET